MQVTLKQKKTMTLEWLQSMIEVISIIESKDANPYWETIWIIKQYFTNSVHFFGKEIMGGHKPQGWEFNNHLYNEVDFREYIKYKCYVVQLCRYAT